MAQSLDGRMWFVSSKGVFNYNAVDWTLMPDSLKLPYSVYTFLRTTSDGSVWVAGQNNNQFTIRRFQEGKWYHETHTELPNIKARFVFSVRSTGDGYRILINDEKALYDWNTSNGELNKVVLHEPGLEVNAITYIDQQYYFCTSDGLRLYQNGELQPTLWHNSFANRNNEVLQVTKSGDDFYMLGLGWVAKSKAGSDNLVFKDVQLETKSIYNKHSLEVDRLGRVFYCSQSTASYIDPDFAILHTLNVDGEVYNARSNRIIIDREGNVWVGDYRGLFKFNLLRFLNYNKNADLAESEVSAILQNGDDMILANPNHFNLLRGDRLVKSISIGNGLNVRVLEMIEDQNGDVFIAASRGGLLKYANGKVSKIKWSPYNDETGITSVEFFNDRLYFTSNQALYAYEQGSVARLVEFQGIRNLERLTSDTLVALSTSEGLALLNKKLEVTWFLAELRDYNNVFSIINWRGQLHVATAGGLATINDSKIIPLGLDQRLDKVPVYCFLIDSQDRLWFGTNEGIFIWDGTTLLNYTRGDGLTGNEINRNALIEDEQGRIWIGTESGASVYTPGADYDPSTAPLIEINEVITQKGTVVNDDADLDYNDNTLEFNYLGISFFDETKVTYRYRLDGFDQEWRQTGSGKDNFIRYTNLSPGDYRFVIQAGIDGENWSTPKSLVFSVAEPIYARPWFPVLITLLLLVLMFIGYRIRFYVMLKQQQKLKAIVKSRTQEIERQHQEIERQNEKLIQQKEEILAINEGLEGMVKERTNQLIEQNKKLLEYTFINSHKLRAPICRILGLINLWEMEPDNRNYMIKLLHKTGNELDEVSREINNVLDTVEPDHLEEFLRGDQLPKN
ncbi:MAG: two-component regulator propeller domain-containing protein [Bacteroidota bacterium]